MKKRLISLLLVVATLLSVAMPLSAGAADVEDDQCGSLGIVTNPLYENPYISEEVQAAADAAPVKLSEAETKDATYVSVSEASKQLRDAMVNRKTSVTLYVQTSYVDTIYDLFENAYSEEYSVGITDGDYLRWSWGSWNGSYTSNSSGMAFYLTISYYTTASQEKEFLNKLNSVMTSLNLSGKSNYQKYKEIYTYVTNNVTYDHAGLSLFESTYSPPQSYYKIFTAWAAMCTGTAVCQGYACMYYAMCKYIGVPVRIITSYNHAYNIVRFGSTWYYVDSTWDSHDTLYGLPADTFYFIRGRENFADDISHIDEEPWNTSAFLAKYPIAERDPKGWVGNSKGWYYFDSERTPVTGWKKISGTWYYFSSGGLMKTGWQKISGKWYYFKSSGAMVTGWYKVDGTWYYFKSSGAMTTGWYKISGTWYYFKSTGAMKTGWLQLGGKWYYFKSSGAMVTGYYTIGGVEYYFDENGVMQ